MNQNPAQTFSGSCCASCHHHTVLVVVRSVLMRWTGFDSTRSAQYDELMRLTHLLLRLPRHQKPNLKPIAASTLSKYDEDA